MGKGVAMCNTFAEWKDEVTRRGFTIDNNGAGKLIAHVDGDEKGIWDPIYGGCGFGWFF